MTLLVGYSSKILNHGYKKYGYVKNVDGTLHQMGIMADDVKY